MTASVLVSRARDAATEDLKPLYVELHRHQVAGAPRMFGLAATDDEVAWTRRRAFYERIDGLIVRITVDGAVEGYAVCGLEPGPAGWGPDSPIGVVYDLVISSRARRRGFGTRVVQRAIQELKAGGAKAVRLNVVDGNPTALAFYARMGFAPMALTLGATI